MDELLHNLRGFAVDELPRLLGPIAVLVVGWVLALIGAAMTRGALRRTNLDDRIAHAVLGEERAETFNSARWTGRAVYYIILLLTLLAFLQAVQLTAATEPLQALLGRIFAFMPRLIGAALILLVGWGVATLARAVLSRAFDRWGVDARVSRETSASEQPETEPGAADSAAQPATGFSRAIAEAAYWLVLLLFAPAVLSALELRGLLEPVQSMMEEALGFLPNLASAALIGAVGWFVARVIQRLVAGALAGVGTDRLSQRVHLDRALGDLPLSSLIGLIAYVLILVPVAVAALNALQLEAITEPASAMLESFFAAVPALFGAALLLAVAYIGGRLLAAVVEKLLNGIGFDRVLDKLGVAQERMGERTPSGLVGGLAMLAVIYFAIVEAAQLLGFQAFADLGVQFAVVGGHILLGLVIFGFGLYLSRVAADAIERSSVSYANVLGWSARIAVLVLAAAMGLRQMGIADEIIELAFGLVLGSVAIAAALAFGLGGRSAASDAIEEAKSHLRNHREVSAGGGAAAASPAAPDDHTAR